MPGIGALLLSRALTYPVTPDSARRLVADYRAAHPDIAALAAVHFSEPATVTRNTAPGDIPIPMVLHCPRCGVQHIDEATEEWANPPHRSHACQAPRCGCIWRPADVATAGVAALPTCGKSDNWRPGDPTLADRYQGLRDCASGRGARGLLA